MRLLTEEIKDASYIVEATKSGKKNVFIEGTFLQADIKNRNGRMYPMEILDHEVNRYVKEFVEAKRAFGELGHPDGPVINLERVSHLIESLKREGTNYIGRAKVLDTPFGKIVKSFIEEGAQLGVSSRGMGSLQQGRGGINVVRDDFHLATAADIVADPSAPEAFVRGIMENKEWIYESGIWKVRDIEEYKREIQKANRLQLEDIHLGAWERFLADQG